MIAEGEVLQLMTANDTSTTEEDYLRVISDKTAELFAAASRIGAVVGERSGARTKRRSMPMAAISASRSSSIDDMLDYSAREAELGKSVGDDFRDGKITLPVVLAFRAGNEPERAFWRRTLEDQEQRDGDLARAIELMNRHGCLVRDVGSRPPLRRVGAPRARRRSATARKSARCSKPSISASRAATDGRSRLAVAAVAGRALYRAPAGV